MPNHGIKCPCRSCCNKFESKGMTWNSDQRRYVKPRQRHYYPNNANWHKPVHGTTADGRPVTASFGKDDSKAENNTGIADGHISQSQYYGRDNTGVKNHDHYGPNGESFADRGRYTD